LYVCRFVGIDFNTELDVVSSYSDSIYDFCDEFELQRSDILCPVSSAYTYTNEALNHHSKIDYILISDHNRLVNFNVIDNGSNLSDHLPLQCIINLNCDLNVTPYKPGKRTSECLC
jgi:endonuclease/exonuclease/phosphatase family metal-dependent hydrolase